MNIVLKQTINNLSMKQTGITVSLRQIIGLVPTGTGSDKNYVHTQNIAATVWTVTHNLGKYPSVTVVDSAGTVVIGQVDYLNTNSLQVTFAAAFSGKVFCN